MQYYVCTGEIGCLKDDCGQILFVHDLGAGGRGDNPYCTRHSGLCAVCGMGNTAAREGRDGLTCQCYLQLYTETVCSLSSQTFYTKIVQSKPRLEGGNRKSLCKNWLSGSKDYWWLSAGNTV